MSHDPYVFAAIAALVLLALYRRFRSSFGRQRLSPTRIKVRIGLLGLATLMLILRGMHSIDFAAAGLVGVAAGAALAWYAIRLTRFDVMPGGLFYTPNGYIGAVLTAVLLGRLVYRFQVLYPSLEAAKAQTGDPFASFQGSPLTVALFGIVLGYYIAYGIGLLIRGAALRSQAPQPAGDAASPPSGP
ncbi:MAG TPA: DUF1453 domain-containing protein [Rhodanobacteraceae bacterium]|nr:DUF1453 domain-containing protein [Rhodanobacteraceae bacterium]